MRRVALVALLCAAIVGSTAATVGAQTTVPAVDPGASGVLTPDGVARRGTEPNGPQARTDGVEAAAVNPEGEFTPLNPARILDTRDGTGGTSGPVGSQATITLTVAGAGGVPGNGIAAAVLNVTATQPTAPSFLTVWPSGQGRPTASNLNFVPGQIVANLVTVAVGSDGRVKIFNHAGSTHVVVDVMGFYATATGPAGSRFHSLPPSRLLDTRNGTGGVPATPIGPNGVLQVGVVGKVSVPSGATAVAINVTVTEPTADSYLTVYPDNVNPRPLASNINFVPGLTIANLVIVRLPANGTIDFYNLNGSTHVVGDVVGWYDENRETETGRFVPLSPARILDTRVQGAPLGPGESRVVATAGQGGVPTVGPGAVVVNVTATEATASGFLVAHPENTFAPLASTLNFTPNQTVPNLAIVRLAPNGNIRLFNFAGSVQAIVDVAGYFTEVTFGFDTCETPSLADMGTWRATSPYTSVGIYFGGGNRACSNTALNNPGWVNTVVAQGWRIIPIYVGLQASCTNYARRINPASAFFSGVIAADDAADRAAISGLPQGVTLYYDMEAYDYTNVECSNASRQFIVGWITQLHARGFGAGYYSSLLSGILDQVRAVQAGDPSLDAIWIAAWNDTPNIYGFPQNVLPDSYWSQHQRLHQYKGGHFETWGGVTLNIDTNVIDGPLAP